MIFAIPSVITNIPGVFEYCICWVAGNFITAVFNKDVTFKAKPRMKLEEVAVFEIKEV